MSAQVPLARLGFALAFLTVVSACSSGGSRGGADFPFVNSGRTSTLADADALYEATFRHLIRTERWVGSDYVCLGIGTMLYDPQAPPGRMVSRLSTGTTRVVAATGCVIGRSSVQHRTTRNQAQLIVIRSVQTTSEGAEAEAFQFTNQVDQELFRCRLTQEDGEWKVERCDSRRV